MKLVAMRPYALLAVLGVVACLGCTNKNSEWARPGGPRVFEVAHRQLPPEPVYNRVRWVHLPEVLPERTDNTPKSPRIFPVIHLNVKNETLESTALVLGSASGYKSYVAASIADRRVTVDQLGTLDELANVIATKHKVRVVIDHKLNQIRFLPNGEKKRL